MGCYIPPSPLVVVCHPHPSFLTLPLMMSNRRASGLLPRFSLTPLYGDVIPTIQPQSVPEGEGPSLAKSLGCEEVRGGGVVVVV